MKFMPDPSPQTKTTTLTMASDEMIVGVVDSMDANEVNCLLNLIMCVL